MSWLGTVARWAAARLLMGREMQRETDRNRAAAEVLDATLKEMLGK
ncbi:hypothetical protein [Oceanicola sp. 502str15]|nr:hypothetical protein [Oceanicola sp. 502str15]MCO6382507.1 hypothetical protein [Oceanicola sp. 502str15]